MLVIVRVPSEVLYNIEKDANPRFHALFVLV